MVEEKNKSLTTSTREQRKQERKRKAEEKKLEKFKKPRVRIIPIWLRLVLVFFFLCISVVAGAMFGYGILGDGAPMDVLKMETWKHIFELVRTE